MIDPYSWQGRIVLSNMEDVVKALRTRLSGHFDLVRGTVFHRNISLAQGEAIHWWNDEYEGRIAITHNYGLDQEGDTVTGNYVLNAGADKVMGDYISFSKDIVYVNAIGTEYYVYIPREENRASIILRQAQIAYDKAGQFHIDELGKVITHKEVQYHSEQIIKASAKEEAVSALIQQIESE